MKGNDIKADAQAVLVDSGIQWADPNMLVWINEAGREIATYKPKATTVRANVQLTAGVTKQPIPANTIAVLDLFANMGADGNAPGRAITSTSADRLRAVRPSWRSDAGAAVKHLVMDDRDPTAFIVWPAPSTNFYVEALLHKQFTALAALTDDITLDASYRTALVDYVLHRAYSMEGSSQAMDLAAVFYGKFAQALGIQIQKQKRASAPANTTENPAYPAVDKNGA